jgi:hypothetical protein
VIPGKGGGTEDPFLVKIISVVLEGLSLRFEMAVHAAWSDNSDEW